MNWQDFIDAMKAIPSLTVEAWNIGQTYWSAAHPVLWILEIVYLVILVSVFYFVVTYTVNIFEAGTSPLKFSLDWWWLMFTPMTQVGTIFLVWGIYSRFAAYIVREFDIPNPNE